MEVQDKHRTDAGNEDSFVLQVLELLKENEGDTNWDIDRQKLYALYAKTRTRSRRKLHFLESRHLCALAFYLRNRNASPKAAEKLLDLVAKETAAPDLGWKLIRSKGT